MSRQLLYWRERVPATKEFNPPLPVPSRVSCSKLERLIQQELNYLSLIWLQYQAPLCTPLKNILFALPYTELYWYCTLFLKLAEICQYSLFQETTIHIFLWVLNCSVRSFLLFWISIILLLDKIFQFKYKLVFLYCKVLQLYYMKQGCIRPHDKSCFVFYFMYKIIRC